MMTPRAFYLLPLFILALIIFAPHAQPAFSASPDWDVTAAGGYSHFGESANALGLDPTITIDRRGDAKYFALDKTILSNTAIEVGFIDFGKANLVLPFIQGVRRINGYYLGVRYCQPMADFSLCAGGAIAGMMREIEDRVGRDRDRVREPLVSLGARYHFNSQLAIGVDWRSATKSKVSAGFVNTTISF
jgi:hypothetical protein